MSKIKTNQNWQLIAVDFAKCIDKVISEHKTFKEVEEAFDIFWADETNCNTWDDAYVLSPQGFTYIDNPVDGGLMKMGTLD